MKKLIFIASFLALAFVASAQVKTLQLTVKKVVSETNQGTTFSSPPTMAFTSNFIGVISGTTDAVFTYQNRTYTVEETFAQVTSQLNVVSGGETTVWGVFDATGGKVTGTYDILDPVSGGAVKLPLGARITFAAYIVETTFASAASTATIALGYATDAAAGIKAALAINDGTTPWTLATAPYPTIPIGTAAVWTAKTTAERNVQAVVAVQNLTAGKLKICIKYVVVP